MFDGKIQFSISHNEILVVIIEVVVEVIALHYHTAVFGCADICFNLIRQACHPWDGITPLHFRITVLIGYIIREIAKGKGCISISEFIVKVWPL